MLYRACGRVQPAALCSVCGKISVPFLQCSAVGGDAGERAYLDQCKWEGAWMTLLLSRGQS